MSRRNSSKAIASANAENAAKSGPLTREQDENYARYKQLQTDAEAEVIAAAQAYADHFEAMAELDDQPCSALLNNQLTALRMRVQRLNVAQAAVKELWKRRTQGGA